MLFEQKRGGGEVAYRLSFIKMHGAGNDFVIVADPSGEITKALPVSSDLLARKLCARHYGIGADGLVYLLPSEQADVKMRMFNPDGSEAEMCGNAIRCIAKLAYEQGIVADTEFTVETLAGIKQPRVFTRGGEVVEVEVNMGPAIWDPVEIPVKSKEAVEQPLEVEGRRFTFTAVSMGNPHCVIFVPSVDEIELADIGPKIETHELFPERTNVEFVEVNGKDRLTVRVWERGAGETLACGTGACAAASAATATSRTDREVKVKLPGGELTIRLADDGVYLKGQTETVFTGEINLK